MKLYQNSSRAFSLICGTLLLTGCTEPNYRNEVSTNAQGAVEVHRVPKDDASPAPEPTPAPASPAPAPAQPTGTLDQRIEALEAQVARLNQEITKLKLQKEAEAPHR